MRIVCKGDTTAGQFVLSLGRDHVLAQAFVDQIPSLRAGMVIRGGNCEIQCLTRIRLADEGDLSQLGWICRTVSGAMNKGEFSATVSRGGFSLAWVTLSDKGSRGEREDKSGPTIRDVVAEAINLSLASGVVIPDEGCQLKAALVAFCLEQKFDLVVTTGGTGIGPRDITPEVTLALLDKRLEGFEQVMTQASLVKTPHGMISRAVAGIMGESLVINLPGSPKAVRENLLAVLPAVRHAIEKLQGDPTDCGQES